MLELNPLRKNKICLSDYNFKQDIDNRLVMAQFSSLDLEVLEEILYSPIRIQVRKLAKNCNIEDEEIKPVLDKLAQIKLVSIEDDTVVVDKELRKYFESQVLKFDPDFKPGMEYLQGLLKKVPIHVLPTWYAIPRTSNNIFESLVEKYLLTPQIFHRYLTELHFGDTVLSGMIQDVFQSHNCKMKASDLIEKFNLSREVFEEYLLLMEFHFVCCVGYEKVDDRWEEIVTPFHEWREYLEFLHLTEAKEIPSSKKVTRKRPNDFSFVEDLSVLLNMAKKRPIPFNQEQTGRRLPNAATLETIASKMENFDSKDPVFLEYFDRLVAKAQLLKLAEIVDGRLCALAAANDWLDMPLENKAVFLYRHPLNKLLSDQAPVNLCAEKQIREAEKSIARVINKEWVYFDAFIKGVIVPLSDASLVMLRKQGRTWKYQLPSYTEEEIALIKAVVLDWLFEVGVVAIGTCDGKECFTVTAFGQSLFG